MLIVPGMIKLYCKRMQFRISTGRNETLITETPDHPIEISRRPIRYQDGYAQYLKALRITRTGLPINGRVTDVRDLVNGFPDWLNAQTGENYKLPTAAVLYYAVCGPKGPKVEEKWNAKELKYEGVIPPESSPSGVDFPKEPGYMEHTSDVRRIARSEETVDVLYSISADGTFCRIEVNQNQGSVAGFHLVRYKSNE